MKTFVPAENFSAYPHGRRVDFKQGVETEAYPVEFVDLMVEKGHVDGKPKDVGAAAGKRASKAPADVSSTVEIDPPADPALPADVQG